LDEFSTARLPVLLLFLICSTFRKDSGTGGITLDTSEGCCGICYYWCHINQATRRQHGGWKLNEICFGRTDQVILLLYYLYDKAHDQFDKTTLMV
jgi:hypothetical protein